MGPGSKRFNVFNGALAYFKLFGNDRAAQIAFQQQSFNLFYFINRQFSQVMILTKWLSFFCDLIFDVVLVRTNKQMIRIYARRIVTMMQNPFFVFNFAKLKFKRHFMGSLILGFNPKNSVSVFVFGSFPFPTLFSGFNYNFAPKSFFNIIHDGRNSICCGMGQ